MQPSTIIQLRKQLESLKQFREKNAPNRFSYIYLGKFALGLYLVARVALMNTDLPPSTPLLL